MIKILHNGLLLISVLAICILTIACQNTLVIGQPQITEIVTTLPGSSASPGITAIFEPKINTTETSSSALPGKPTLTLTFTRLPFIHNKQAKIYETLFSIPIDSNSFIKYQSGPSIIGPNAIAILPDDTFLISDLIGKRLINYDNKGHLLRIIDLNALGIGYIRDLRVAGDEIYLLETGYKKFQVHRLTLRGEIITNEEIPYEFQIDEYDTKQTLEGGLSGIIIDCEHRTILEVLGGSKLWPLAQVNKQSDPFQIPDGLLCNDKRYFVSQSAPYTDPQVTAGYHQYQTRLTYGLGGLRFLDVFPSGVVYLIRDDVVTEPKITVDQTLHFIGAGGSIQGVARIPISEFYYPVIRNAAISSSGEVYVLLPRQDSIDVIRVNFFQELEPFVPGAETPKIITNSD